MSAEDPLVMIPGPTPVSAAVREAMAAPVRGHTTAENAASLARIRDGLRQVTGAATSDVYVLPGSGTLAMEVALVNHVRPGERVVVVNHGFFADRFAAICESHGMVVDQVKAEWGRRASAEAVRAALRASPRPALLTITHVDTSTGTRAEVEALSAIAREEGVMVLLDGVCSTAGLPETLDDWGVDLLVTGSQKALATPPGLAVVVSSPTARTRRQQVATRGYYTDLDRWDAPMTSTAYFATHATSLVRALDVSIQEILGEGLQPRFARHEQVAATMRAGLSRLGFSLQTDPAALAPTLTVAAPPAGVDEARLRAGILADGVLVAGGIGPFAGRVIRIGHMGNAREAEVAQVLEAVEGALPGS